MNKREKFEKAVDVVLDAWFERQDEELKGKFEKVMVASEAVGISNGQALLDFISIGVSTMHDHIQQAIDTGTFTQRGNNEQPDSAIQS